MVMVVIRASGLSEILCDSEIRPYYKKSPLLPTFTPYNKNLFSYIRILRRVNVGNTRLDENRGQNGVMFCEAKTE